MQAPLHDRAHLAGPRHAAGLGGRRMAVLHAHDGDSGEILPRLGGRRRDLVARTDEDRIDQSHSSRFEGADERHCIARVHHGGPHRLSLGRHDEQPIELRTRPFFGSLAVHGVIATLNTPSRWLAKSS
jgi:hypothetical protein